MADKRGVLYVVWGTRHEALLERSMASVRTVHPELPIHVERLPDTATLLDKAAMAEMTPYEETVFLDTDTVVLDRLDYAFEKAAAVGLALSICECPWARRYGGIGGDVIEYNTGVLFFTKKAQPVFDAWKAVVRDVDSSIRFIHNGQQHTMPLNDQAGFALAVEQSGFVPFVLPYNWNFRPKWHLSWFGPIKIWHDFDAVPEPLLANNRAQAEPDAIIAMSAFR